MPYLMINDMLTNDIVSFEQLGPGFHRKIRMMMIWCFTSLSALFKLY